MIRESFKKIFNKCFMTCFLTERKRRNRSFSDDGYVIFSLLNLSKRVLNNDRSVYDDDDDNGENYDFQ